MYPHLDSSKRNVNTFKRTVARRTIRTSFLFLAVLQLGGNTDRLCDALPEPRLLNPPEGKTLFCQCDGACFFDVKGTLSRGLLPSEDLCVVIRPIDNGEPRYFIQFGDKEAKNIHWNAQVQIGSDTYPAQSGQMFEIWVVTVATEGADCGPLPTEPLPSLSEETIPCLLAKDGPHTVTVGCKRPKDYCTPQGPPFTHRLFLHLDSLQDPGTGILESFVPNDELPVEFKSYLSDRPAFIYDNALAALAYLNWPNSENLDRANGILQAFLDVQARVIEHVRDGLLTPPVGIDLEGALYDVVKADTLEPMSWDFGTGNQMWVALALLKGYRLEGREDYLRAAVKIGDFVLQQKNVIGYGGFVLMPNDHRVGTEHNVDAYAAFTQLAREMTVQGDLEAAVRFENAATHARVFVESRFDPITGRTFTGTDETGIDTNRFPVPEDTQTWTLLGLGREKWRRGYDWLFGPDGLWTRSTSCPTLGGVETWGPSFSDADLGEVWFEGLAHVWLAALLLDDVSGSPVPGWPPKPTLEAIQNHAPHTDCLGIIAACETLDTGFGFQYFNALAVGSTAWSILAGRDVNAFWDVQASGGFSHHPASTLPTVALDVPAESLFSCDAGSPCEFSVSGASWGVAGRPGLSIHVLVRPTAPAADGYFVQLSPANVAADGSWTASAALGSSHYPASSGDEFELSAIIVDVQNSELPWWVCCVTRDEIQDLVTVSGILSATVQVGPGG